MTPRTAVITVVHGRHAHFETQQAGLAQCLPGPHDRIVVAMADPVIATLAGPDTLVVPCAADTAALPLAHARNLGARTALDRGAELLIFLDVDCIPGREMIGRYVAAHRRTDRPALLCGPVTYLPPARGGYPLDRLDQLPHGARILRGAEVQAVGDRERLGTHGGHIAVRLSEGQLRPGAGVEFAIAPVGVGGQGHAAPGGLIHPHHTGVVRHGQCGVAAHVAVVLVGDPGGGGQVG